MANGRRRKSTGRRIKSRENDQEVVVPQALACKPDRKGERDERIVCVAALFDQDMVSKYVLEQYLGRSLGH